MSTARPHDPETSKEAARSSAPSWPTVREGVLTIVQLSGPLTLDQLVAVYRHMPSLRPAADSSIRTRCKELENAGYVEVIPNEYGTTTFGRRAQLVRATFKKEEE